MPQDLNHQETILNILKNLQGIDPLRELFWTELNYDRQSHGIPRHDWTDTAKNALVEDPVLFATGGIGEAFQVIYARLNSDRLLLTAERPVISRLLQDHPYTLFVFSNREQTDWHFANVKYDTEAPKRRRLFRRITISPHEKLRTASERIAMLDLEFIDSLDPEGLSPLAIQDGHDKAFNVEAVTKQFFEDYQSVFHILQDDLTNQTEDRRWAHDYALQFLNRCMFLYFIQRKGWLGDNTKFLRSFWESYQETNEQVDSFVDRWLNVLFFEAFNNKFHGGHRHFPDTIREALSLAPYLNGGLFTENALDGEHDFQISDQRFEGIFEFLENYNFTIAEDSPLDQEVAVDPEMIGKVYESLVNVSDEADERGDAGIFYTPRTEIDLMCRLALVDNLTNHLGETHKDLLYEVLFAFDPDDKAEADRKLAEVQLWEPLNTSLRGLAVVDPACGSGSFLVGMLHILNDLRDRVNQGLGREESSFDRKKGIIGQNLYGVDVMEWACHVAELRLWLALVINAEFSREELHARHEPLLPHFSFNIRCGDSLVQEIGGMNLATLRDAFIGMPRALKGRITRLKNAKLQFFNNDPACPYRSEKELEQEELRLFRELIDTRTTNIKQQIDDLQQLINGPQERQMRLDGTVEESADRQLELEAMEWQKQIEALTENLDRLEAAHSALVSARGVPFVWDIAFVEIFTGEKGGFDIVIGNPPYVRQESIADPNIPREAVTTENKKGYKAKLARSVYQAFPHFFGYRRERDIRLDNPSPAVSHKLDAKSDLYIYFYFHGLSLLNPKGAFCFITSNSWLDAGYGKDLQEFTLKHCHIKQIIDNEARRSFASADVNTVICLLSAPDEKRQWGLDQTTRFVMFKIPFEGILDAVIFYEIETAPERLIKQEHRVFPIPQGDLLEGGSDDTTPQAKYTGDKWGGKYLRAPDIYWTILSKGKKLIQQLSTYFDGERYLNTGGADGFFILTQASKIGKGLFYVSNNRTTTKGNKPFEGEIEGKYLRPLIKDYTKNDKRIEIHGYDTHCFVVTDEPSIRAQRYIEWGEEQGYHLRSVTKNQHPWFKPTNQMTSAGKILVPRSFNDTFLIHSNPNSYLSLRFYRLHLKKGEAAQLVGFLNSTLVALFLETLGSKNLGQGVLNFFMADFLSMKIPVVEGTDLEQAYKNLRDRSIYDVRTEYGAITSKEGIMQVEPLADRRQLDNVIFDALNFTQGERDGVYEAVIHLVEARLQKAQSLRGG